MTSYVKLFLLGICFYIVTYLINIIIYKQTSYYKNTGNSFYKVRKDRGLLGEYLIFKNLEKLEKKGAKFLFNCYIPSKNDKTTEIDVIMIYEKGIFVFESKNYSGWIYGNENDYQWTQVLPQGKGKKARKEKFFNPIKQNDTHVKWLRNYIDDEFINIFPIVVFSNRCTFKEIVLYNPINKVVKRNNLYKTVIKISKSTYKTIDEETINTIYKKLLPFTKASELEKQNHIEEIKRKYH